MTMAMVARPLRGTLPHGRTRSVGPTVEIASDLDDVADAWRGLEADAVMAPYGRLDWVAAYQRALPEAERRTRVAIGRDASDEIVFLLPVQIERRGLLTVAAAIGGKHANYNLPLMRRDFASRLTPEEASRILMESGRALGVDLISLPNVPVSWDGWQNPFAVGGQASANDAWALRLAPDGEAALTRSMSGEARKKMRNKARGLAKLGLVRILRATTASEVEQVLEAYFLQKAERFATLGITDPFSDRGVRDFLRDAATPGGPGLRPAIELHALMLMDDVIAVLGGATDGRRFSGMIVSFQAGPIEKFSPGEMLVTSVIKDLGGRGHAVFDLGAGDARYKRSICDEAEPLVDVVVPLSWRGRAAALARSVQVGAKRRLKADARVMAMVSRMRRLKSHLRP